ncbi:VOC family protein [Sphingobium scionense]
MALTGVLRPGYVQLRVLDLDEAIQHYRDRIGLNLVSVEGGRAFFHAFDEFDRHSIILREADSAGLDRMAFKVARDADLDHFAERLLDIGVHVDVIAWRGSWCWPQDPLQYANLPRVRSLCRDGAVRERSGSAQSGRLDRRTARYARDQVRSLRPQWCRYFGERKDFCRGSRFFGGRGIGGRDFGCTHGHFPVMQQQGP